MTCPPSLLRFGGILTFCELHRIDLVNTKYGYMQTSNVDFTVVQACAKSYPALPYPRADRACANVANTDMGTSPSILTNLYLLSLAMPSSLMTCTHRSHPRYLSPTLSSSPPRQHTDSQFLTTPYMRRLALTPAASSILASILPYQH